MRRANSKCGCTSPALLCVAAFGWGQKGIGFSGMSDQKESWDEVGNPGSWDEVKSLVWLECSSPGAVCGDAQCVVPALYVT